MINLLLNRKTFHLKRTTAVSKFLLVFASIFYSCGSFSNQMSEKEKSVENYTPNYLIDFKENSFKISIEAFGNHFGGILVAKRLAENHYRFAIINEFGGKLMDFEIQHRKLKLNYAIDELDRKIILNLLEKDFALLFSEKNLIEKEFDFNESTVLKSSDFVQNKDLYYYLNDLKLGSILLAKNKEKVRVNILNTEQSFPQVEILHGKIPIKIYLHLLENE